jgi:hypothetical protein
VPCRARDVLARKFAKAGASLEILAAMAFLTGGGKEGKEDEDGLNGTESKGMRFPHFWPELTNRHQQPLSDLRSLSVLRLFSVMSVVVITGASRFSRKPETTQSG